jgi:hypothetical protein
VTVPPDPAAPTTMAGESPDPPGHNRSSRLPLLVAALAAVLLTTAGALLLTQREGSQVKSAVDPAHVGATPGMVYLTTTGAKKDGQRAGIGTVFAMRPDGTLGRTITVGGPPGGVSVAS